MTYRVVQWATGAIGKTCLRGVLDSTDLELVGLYVYGAGKAGRDAGAIARRPEVNVLATRDIEQILALDADVVLHTPRLQLPYSTHDTDLCRLLRSGKNVITTAGNHYPQAHGAERLELFETACAEGGSTLFGVGVSPGVIGERIAMALAATSFDLDAIEIDEVFDASGMQSPDFVFTVMGMGTDPTAVDLHGGALADLYRTLYSETLCYMADTLGLTDYVIVDDHHFELTTVDVRVGAGTIRAGTVVATEWRWHLQAQGHRRLSLTIVWTMDPALPRYAGRPHWQIRMTGKPGLTASIDLHDPEEPGVRTTGGQYITAGIVLRAVPVVVAAPAGVLQPVTFAPYRYR